MQFNERFNNTPAIKKLFSRYPKENAPTWLVGLAQMIDDIGLKNVADKVGYSVAVLSLIINGKYAGNIANVKKAVMPYLNDVDCPLFGIIKHEKCKEQQEKQFSYHSQRAIAEYKICKACKKNRSYKHGR